MTLRILLPALIGGGLVMVWAIVHVVRAFAQFDQFEDNEDRE